MQASQLSSELGRLRAQELIRRAERYHGLELNRRQCGDLAARRPGHGALFVLRRVLAALVLSTLLLLTMTGGALAAEKRGAPRRSTAGTSTRLDLTPAVVAVLVLIGVGLAAEVKRQLDRHA